MRWGEEGGSVLQWEGEGGEERRRQGGGNGVGCYGHRDMDLF